MHQCFMVKKINHNFSILFGNKSFKKAAESRGVKLRATEVFLTLWLSVALTLQISVVCIMLQRATE